MRAPFAFLLLSLTILTAQADSLWSRKSSPFIFRDGGLSALCQGFREQAKGLSCFTQYEGESRSLCELCREKRSCFMALSADSRAFCEAYQENRSCFMSFNGEDRGWCEVVKEKKSCFIALEGEARQKCEQGWMPPTHWFWSH